VPIPDAIRSPVELALAQYCREKVPAHVTAKLKLGYSARGNSITLFEERPSMFDQPEWVRIVVAQFRYHPSDGTWTLHCADRNSRWHQYDDLDPNTDFRVLLQEVDADPTGIFWG
jgi:hypothetical protein